MTAQAADALMSIFGFERVTCMVYNLKRGDMFTVKGSDTAWTFDHMDGMYCYATGEQGRILNWSGPVEKVV